MQVKAHQTGNSTIQHLNSFNFKLLQLNLPSNLQTPRCKWTQLQQRSHSSREQRNHLGSFTSRQDLEDTAIASKRITASVSLRNTKTGNRSRGAREETTPCSRNLGSYVFTNTSTNYHMVRSYLTQYHLHTPEKTL
jgi:hypothetical protein